MTSHNSGKNQDSSRGLIENFFASFRDNIQHETLFDLGFRAPLRSIQEGNQNEHPLEAARLTPATSNNSDNGRDSKKVCAEFRKFGAAFRDFQQRAKQHDPKVQVLTRIMDTRDKNEHPLEATEPAIATVDKGDNSKSDSSRGDNSRGESRDWGWTGAAEAFLDGFQKMTVPDSEFETPHSFVKERDQTACTLETTELAPTTGSSNRAVSIVEAGLRIIDRFPQFTKEALTDCAMYYDNEIRNPSDNQAPLADLIERDAMASFPPQASPLLKAFFENFSERYDELIRYPSDDQTSLANMAVREDNEDGTARVRAVLTELLNDYNIEMRNPSDHLTCLVILVERDKIASVTKPLKIWTRGALLAALKDHQNLTKFVERMGLQLSEIFGCSNFNPERRGSYLIEVRLGLAAENTFEHPGTGQIVSECFDCDQPHPFGHPCDPAAKKKKAPWMLLWLNSELGMKSTNKEARARRYLLPGEKPGDDRANLLPKNAVELHEEDERL